MLKYGTECSGISVPYRTGGRSAPPAIPYSTSYTCRHRNPPDPGNAQVYDSLRGIGPDDSLVFHERAELHAKGIVGDAYALIGSMNLTYNGLDRLTEMLIFNTDRPAVEPLRLSFRQEYGGRA